MHQLIKSFLSQLSSCVNDFGVQHQLPCCKVQTFLTSMQRKDNTVACNTVGCDFRSSPKQIFDVCLSFRNVHLKQWWQLLPRFAIELQNSVSILPICSVKLYSENVLHIHLDRSSFLVLFDRTGLQSFMNDFPTNNHPEKIVMMKLDFPKTCSDGDSYLLKRRFFLLATFLENLLLRVGSNLIGSEMFDSFLAGTDFGAPLKPDYYSEYVHLIHSYLNHLQSSNLVGKTSQTYLIILVRSTEALHMDTCLQVLQSKFDWRLQMKIIKIGPICVDEPQWSTVQSFDQFKCWFIKQQWISTEQLSPDGLDVIARTMELWTLFSSTARSHRIINQNVLKTNTHESIFIQYNLARIQNIIGKFDAKFVGDSTVKIDYSLLSDSEWSIIWIFVVRFQVLNLNLLNQIFHSEIEGLDCLPKIIATISQLCHQFSCYYRNVRILLDPEASHLVPLMAARVRICWMIFKIVQHYLTLFNVGTIDKI